MQGRTKKLACLSRNRNASVCARRLTRSSSVPTARNTPIWPRRASVGNRLRNHFLALLRQPIADREQRIAARREIRSPILEGAASARLPSSAMRGNERGKRPGAGGQIKVARERNAVVGGVGEAATGFDLLLGCGHCGSS